MPLPRMSSKILEIKYQPWYFEPLQTPTIFLSFSFPLEAKLAGLYLIAEQDRRNKNVWVQLHLGFNFFFQL